jgi:hypothetical protein
MTMMLKRVGLKREAAMAALLSWLVARTAMSWAPALLDRISKALGRMTRVNVKRWTRTQRGLGAAGVTLLVLGLERLANAAMVREAATASVALGFGLVLGVMGAMMLAAVFVISFVRRESA